MDEENHIEHYYSNSPGICAAAAAAEKRRRAAERRDVAMPVAGSEELPAAILIRLANCHL